MKSDSNKQQKFWAVIPGAGLGQRFGADCPKQYASLCGLPIIRHTLDTFLQHPLIEAVVVVVHPEDQYWSTVYASEPRRLWVTTGGEQRVDSVLQGLCALEGQADENDWVLVHDAARPCLPSQAIQRLIDQCQHDPVGGLLGMPVTHTLKQVSAEQAVENTVSRVGVWEAQTPQMFRYGLLKAALSTLTPSDRLTITDEASAMERQGVSPRMVMGDASNIKVTHAEDLALAEWYIQQETAS